MEKVQIYKDGSLCRADVRMKNVTDKEKTVYTVMTLWRGKKGIDVKISPIKLAPYSAADAALQTETEGADTAEVYVYSDLEASEFLCSRIYKKEF